MDKQAEGLANGDSQTIRRALMEGAQLLSSADTASARLDADVLLGHVLNMEKADVYLNFDAPLNHATWQKFRELLMRRAKREPLAYITGRKEFWSLDFAVTTDVLIPRPETELLVELTLARCPGKSLLKVLDIGTGSGVLAVALAKELPEAKIWAVDVSDTALKIAGINSRRHRVAERIQFLCGDLFDPVAELKESFDLILANPPYIPSKELALLAPEIRDWEPLIALDGGPEGLSTYRSIIDKAHHYLASGGHVLLEIGSEMGHAVAELFARAGGYGIPSIYQDYAGEDRVIAATKLLQLEHQGFSHG